MDVRRSRIYEGVATAFFSATIVEELYRGIFGREPKAQELAHWRATIRDGKPLAEVIHEMISSEEMQRSYATELYRGILNREPDDNGLAACSRSLANGLPLHDAIRGMLNSDEFQSSHKGRTLKQSELLDIRSLLPRPYETQVGLDNLTHHVLKIEDDSEFDLLERLIVDYRFYDSFGGWGYSLNLDKVVSAAIARGLGARTCLDIGCSNGPVISLLADADVEVAGIDSSHLAFALAFPNIRNRMLYGDLLSVDLQRKFDVVLAMDIFEHISPLKVGKHIDRAAALVDRDGYLFVNSPMYGRDATFGMPFPLHLAQWKDELETAFWHHIPCDEKGWPWDGHLIWAAVPYWEHLFTSRGLVRDRELEATLQHVLAGFFAEFAPARKAIFVLRWPENNRCSSDVAKQLSDTILAVEGLPSSR